MVDFAMDVHKSLYPDQEVPGTLKDKRSQVVVNFKTEMIDICYNFAKFQYECGNYSGASEYLYFHRILVQPTDKNYLNGMWGKLAAEILMQNR